MKIKTLKKLLLFLLLLSEGTIVVAAPQATTPDDTLAVICLNDFHGGFVRDSTLKIPGAGNIYSSIMKIKNRYPANIVVAVGDNFGGSFFSNQTQGELLPYFFNKLGIRVSALGNHEFDNGQDFLAEKWGSKKPAGWNITYICGNIEYKNKSQIPGYVKSDTVCQIKVGEDSVKIGFLGLITSSAGSETKKENVENLTFGGQYESILRNMCQKGIIQQADIKVLVAHIGTEEDSVRIPKWKKDNFNLPDSIIGIASGHSHNEVCGRINNIPVVQGEINGKKIGVLRFVRNNGRWGSIDPVLYEVKNVKDTSAVRSEIDSIIAKKLSEATAPGMGLTCNLAKVRNKLYHERSNDKVLTALGSYVCMSYAWAYRKYANKECMDSVVVAFSHFGGIRRSLPKGTINILAAGEVLPFANKLRVYELTGEEIRNIVKAGMSNKKGQLQMNNIVVDTIHYNKECQVVNVHYVVPGKKDIILSDIVKYPVIVDEFISTGGDGYDQKMFPETSWRKEIEGLYTTPSFLNFLWTLSDEMNEDYIYKAKINGTSWR